MAQEGGCEEPKICANIVLRACWSVLLHLDRSLRLAVFLCPVPPKFETLKKGGTHHGNRNR